MKFVYLGSGSRGNCALVETDQGLIMLDCGFSLKETEKRLRRLGRRASDVTAVLVTHEHSDHISGVAPFARRYRVPVWMTSGTYSAAKDKDIPNLHVFNCHRRFSLADVEVTPVPVPHDAREPCQFVFRRQSKSLGILTDVGHVTPHMVDSFSRLDALVLECNHDLDLLSKGPYPQSLKQRVAGRWGHLNNDQAASMLKKVHHDHMQHVLAVHISEKNNTRTLAQTALARVLEADPSSVVAVDQDVESQWWTIE
ncbi:MAG: MBL fold metallo-hydrolase [Pseudomonadota bacterium]